MRLATTGLFKAHWTERIHQEWINSVLKQRPDIAKSKLLNVKRLMDAHVGDALIDNYEALESGLNLPDKNDNHVLAAAIKSSSDAIVTFNLKDFPADLLAKYEIEAIHPDEFISNQIDLSPARVVTAINKMRLSLAKPPVTAQELLVLFERNQLPITAGRLREYIEQI